MSKLWKIIARYRTLFLFGGAAVAFYFSLYWDPDKDRNTGISMWLGALALGQGIWAVAAAFYTRKSLHDYPEADTRRLFAKASEGSIGAGLALIALAISFVGLLLVFAPRAHAADLPSGFLKYGPTLKAEQQHYWASHPAPELLASLVEQESCVSLKSKSCWNPAAKLKTAREEGAGMGQITRAYRADGSMRFDSLIATRAQYGDALGEWSWDNVYTRPELQLRAIVLMSKDAAMPFRAASGMLEFGDAAYNGGASDVQRARRICAMTAGCDAAQWFGHVELHCVKSRQPLYGGRSACDINREHVHNVFLVRRAKYVKAWTLL